MTDEERRVLEETIEDIRGGISKLDECFSFTREMTEAASAFDGALGKLERLRDGKCKERN